MSRLRTVAIFLVSALIGLGPVALISSSANAASSATTLTSAQYPLGLASDSNGNIYIAADENTSNPTNKGLLVIPSATGTLFGNSVTANEAFLLVPRGAVHIGGVAVDASNNVYYSNSNSDVHVISATTQNIFGVAVTANVPARIITGSPSFGGPLDFDSAGNLFGVSVATNVIGVLPRTTTSLYGISLVANTPQQITMSSPSGAWLWDLAIDVNDNILMSDGWGNQGVWIYAKTSGTYYGQSVTADTFTRLTSFDSVGRAAGIDADSSGNIFVVQYGSSVHAYAPTATTLFGQSFLANSFAQLTNVSGGYVNQGLAVLPGGDLVSGGYSNTYRLSWSAPLAVPSISLSSTSLTSRVNTALSTTYAITNSGGVIANYSISPSLPTGVTLNTSTGLISGTPSLVSSSTVYTLSATNASGTSTALYTLEITAEPTPAAAPASTQEVIPTPTPTPTPTPSKKSKAVTTNDLDTDVVSTEVAPLEVAIPELTLQEPPAPEMIAQPVAPLSVSSETADTSTNQGLVLILGILALGAIFAAMANAFNKR